VLTPRRTVLLLAGFVLFGCAYLLYAQLLGWIDGLPQLPPEMLVQANGTFTPPERTVSPTQQRLIEAFGENSRETNYSVYETQLEFRNGDSSTVLAAGKLPSNPNSNRVTLAPFSLAIFSKPKPAHLRLPGEVTEVSTIHADKGIIEFDRVVSNPNDMKKAKLVRLELVSDFENAGTDPRRGLVHITNNQRSNDPNRFLVIRTVGPMFYRDAKAVIGTPAAQGPDLWTDAPVEIVDRQNLPRPIGTPTPVTAISKSEELRNATVIANILNGQRSPPPTVSAIGLRVYLEPPPPEGQKKPPKAAGSPANGVRRIEFLEQVVLNLWIDNGQSLVGGAPPEPGKPSGSSNTSLALVPPPPAIAAITGGLGTTAYNVRLQNRALLQIDTRGSFAYDAEKSLARFDVVPHSDPNLPNDVQVTKIPATGGTTSLFSQILELEFNGGPTSGTRPANAAAPSPAIKRLHAWTNVAGRYITLAAEDEATEAYGQDLTHDHAANRTVLTGSPLYVIRERNVLSAGAVQRPATLTTEPGPAPARKPQITVRGTGKLELFDTTTNSTNVTASWKTALAQTTEVIGGREQDLFTFIDDAKFEDVKADYKLEGNVLKLWLEPRGNQAKSHSTEYIIEEADHLTVHFSDAKPNASDVAITPPKLPVSPVAPPVTAPSVVPPPMGPPAPVPPAAVAKEPAKQKPPIRIRAKTIETRITRVPTAVTAPAPGANPMPPAPATTPGVKYQLTDARCEDNVTVHQDPVDRNKTRGIDILGRLLIIKSAPEGSAMTVFGWPEKLSEVHQEEMSLIGPKVILDQIHNSASVEGRGALTMPTNSDFAGGELNQPEVVVIHWRESMNFNGAKKSAQFVGKVSATQGESWVLCHTMNVVFDRPIYFNQTQKKPTPPRPAVDPKDPKAVAAAKKEETAKIDKVFCYPAPADSADDKRELLVTFNQVEYDKNGKVIKTQQLRAQELAMYAQMQDATGGEKFQQVVADGPGTLRIWQLGDKNLAAPGAPPANGKPMPGMPPMPAPQPKQPNPANGPSQEMKLTLVTFQGRMIAIDKGKMFQKATFEDSVEAINVPAEQFNLTIDRHNLPQRAVMLRCEKELVVWSHKKQDGQSTQKMDATGNAYLASDEYEGWAQTISNDGKLIVLSGSDSIPARIMNRFNQGNDQPGKKIIYDRAAGSYRVIEGFGGTISPPPRK
jgi:hypothetical protein